MVSQAETTPWAPRWLHGWAILTAAATAVLLALGAVVTTFRVGMADPVWPTYPWHLLLVSWDEPRPGFLIEHTHRLAGYLVGCCVIVLAVGLWLARTPRWLKVLGGLALAGVILQGLLGGFRVYLHALLGPNLAAIHGLFAQVVFCLLVAIAVLTSPRLRVAPALAEAGRLRLLALLLAALCLAQLTWGTLLRHFSDPLAERLHLATAFAVVAAAAWLAAAAAADPAARRRLRVPLALLGVFLLCQVLLGVEAWRSKVAWLSNPYGNQLPELELVTAAQAVIRVAHVLVGSWILAAAVSVVLLLPRSAAVALPLPADEADELFPSTNGIRAAGRLKGTA
jgi:heme A synthase